ncbi:MAG: branched-chain amino acid ABC transporter permease [Candidatus Caldarchaeum sp.]
MVEEFIAKVLLPTTLNGLAFGISISLLSVGLTLVFGIAKIINFAHGEMFMMGGWVAFVSILFLENFWVGLLIAVLFMSGFGFLIERYLISRLYTQQHSPLLILILTFGLALIIRESVRVFTERDYTMPDPVGVLVPIAGTHYPVYRLLVITIGLIFYLFFWFLINRTRLGIIIRAASEDSEMVSCLGINVRRVYTYIFVLGSALAAFAGVIMTPLWSLTVDIGATMILWAFIIIIIGGMGSIGGSILASILFGQIFALGSIWLEPREMEILIFGTLVTILLVRPRGFFGKPGVLE